MLHIDPSMLQDVPFAWDAASKLKQEFLRTADELEGQIGGRQADGHEALHEWRGGYAREFEHTHLAITTGDARQIAAVLRTCAEMLHELANLARKEQDRREAMRAWQVKHDAWQRDQADDGLATSFVKSIVGDGEPKPPDLDPITPRHIEVNAPPVRHRG
jgi:hypothetical protein